MLLHNLSELHSIHVEEFFCKISKKMDGLQKNKLTGQPTFSSVHNPFFFPFKKKKNGREREICKNQTATSNK